ncbi:Peptidyl-prolyl cis-trans isomerase fkbp19, chloroplastic [Pleodorina starrii]|uniref:peptidylprolyl isomerase n=1 Tax=Pleodorina starrii TaxID=330485 RepID=A0A9W6BNY2_9CHLO|nr:Peptidyl-prolyl cis-trans isomerase fkbp19 [Pleodorina starrii]GLC55463.1 Peptidyl-prolyl cis-trans isomerase fkbp19, chloroplastic [Pleodorina starrii]GLC73855.1 Peptidyl-prolyl cis-trans isomerase fkbp19 [Pleodorina starrii]
MNPTLTRHTHRPAPFGSCQARGRGSAGRACHATQAPHAPVSLKPLALQASRDDVSAADSTNDKPSRRALLAGAAAALLPAAALLSGSQPALAEADGSGIAKYEPMDALKGKDYGKPRMTYKDYTTTASGLQFQDLKLGEGEAPRPGDTVIVDWDGYTIGYYGRPFEARNKPKGSSFSGDNKDFYRFVLGEGKVIPAFEEAVASMKPGGIRRIVVPVELGYPENDWRRLGPKPSTFAGDRALDFVLANRGMIDKTLLFDVELVRVLPPAAVPQQQRK